jgi:predicted AlkP superfamily pyrophosphatase or phosphodiesterase
MLRIILVLMCSLQLAAAQNKKVLFVIADGIPASELEKANKPAIDAIISKGAYLPCYVGGEKSGLTQSPTISAVGYNSLLTGTWTNKHGVVDNDIQNPNYNYPTIFKVFKEAYPNKKIGVFSTWLDNRTKLVGDGLTQTNYLHVDYHRDGYELDTVQFPHDKKAWYIHLIDEKVVAEASKVIKDSAPDMSWVYLEYTDDMGHKYGKSPELDTAISMLDKQIGSIMQAVNYREKNFNEEWLVIITTDHGRDALTGKDHGGQSDAERNTWLVMNHRPNHHAFENRTAIVDIFPTIATFLNIKLSKNVAEALEGISLLDPKF